MILQLVIPRADPAFEGGVLTKWHIDEGDEIPFGSPVCDIEIDEFLALQRTKRASLLGSTSKKRQRRISDGVYRREGRGAVTIRLVCAESQLLLRRRDVAEGARVRVGGPVAILGGANDPIPETFSGSIARISTEFPDAEELDPFD
jgi:hypothetical protein